MNDRGLATVVIVAVVAVVAVVGVAAFFLLSSGSSGGVPVYPGATEAQAQGMNFEQILTAVGQNLPTGWSGNMYQTTSNSSTIIGWYKNNLPGWTKTYENEMVFSSDVAMRYLGFTKASDGAFVIALDAAENHYIIIINGPAKGLENLITGGF